MDPNRALDDLEFLAHAQEQLPKGCICGHDATETTGLIQYRWDSTCPVHHIAPSIPPAVLARVAWCVTQLHAWNAAIAQARQVERLAQAPGRYEYDLRYSLAGAQARAQRDVAWLSLEALEHSAARLGISADALYAAVGGKPTLAEEGEAVAGWH